MIAVQCIEKFRDKQGRIYGYRLRDTSGQTKDVKPENLKRAIANKQIQVVNLTLTSDGRLVDKASDNLQSAKLGDTPVKKQTREDLFFEAIHNIEKGFCDKIGTDEPDNEEYDVDKEYVDYSDIIYDAYSNCNIDISIIYDNTTDDEDIKTYIGSIGEEVNIPITTKAQHNIYIVLTNTDMYDLISVQRKLKRPLYSNNNITIIKEAFDEFYNKFEKFKTCCEEVRETGTNIIEELVRKTDITDWWEADDDGIYANTLKFSFNTDYIEDALCHMTIYNRKNVEFWLLNKSYYSNSDDIYGYTVASNSLDISDVVDTYNKFKKMYEKYKYEHKYIVVENNKVYTFESYKDYKTKVKEALKSLDEDVRKKFKGSDDKFILDVKNVIEIIKLSKSK